MSAITAASAPLVTLNGDQERAYAEIGASIIMKRQHLLTGHAGSGKTTLLQAVAARHADDDVVLTAPTHKACEVLSRKLRAAGIETPVQTIHSLLSLRPKSQGDKQVFVRAKNAKPVFAKIVIVDEASMLDSSMMVHIKRWLDGRAVIFCGDPAQLPPVGETASLAFDTMPASHLHGIVRQARGNPIIEAAAVIRASQGTGAMDWSWTAPVRSGDTGIFSPGAAADAWMKKGFLSAEFARDPDHFRVLTWTNDRVAMFNTRVRGWFGYDLSVPFVPGERALIRSPLVVGNEILIATNEEVTVLAIEADLFRGVASWAIRVRTGRDVEHDIHTPRDMDGYRIALARLADDAKGDGYSWDAYHEFKAAFLQMQALYALTTHAAQGSTFKTAFVDMPEMRRWMRKMPDEGGKGLYVAATRASHSLILVGG